MTITKVVSVAERGQKAKCRQWGRGRETVSKATLNREVLRTERRGVVAEMLWQKTLGYA